MITKEFVNFVREKIAANPAVSTLVLAHELQSPEADIVMVLPKAMRIRADNSHYDDIWHTMHSWKNAVLLLPSGHEGPLATLCLSSEQYDCTPAGHSSKTICLRPRQTQEEWKDTLGSIWFVTQQYKGHETRSIRFFDKQGNRMFIVSLEPSCTEEEIHTYETMRERIGIVTLPPKLGCCGNCKGCKCNGQHDHDTDHHSHERMAV